MCKRILKSQTSTSGDIPFYKIGTFGKEADTFINKDLFDTYKNLYNFPNKGDILISAAGTIGRCVVYNGEDSYYQDSNIVWIDNDESIILNDYLYYVLDNITWNPSKGSTILRLYNDDIRKKVFYAPDLMCQRVIADTLKTIDKKITLNRQINDNLEAMAKQLYDYWFVQFDFPNEEGKPYKSSGGVMVWNEKLKRKIPQGWSNGVLSDVANITMGQSPDGSSYNEDGEGIIFYQGSTDFGLRFPDIRQYTTSPSRYANKGDILMSVRAPVGALNIANNNCCIGRGLSALSSKIGSMTHLYYLLNDFRLKFEGMNSAGTTFGSITKDELFSLPVIIPTKSVISEFEQVCEPIFDKQMIIGEEINALTKQRDELLPLLMNGQASVNYHLSAKVYPLPIAYKKVMPIVTNQTISNTFIQKFDNHTPSPCLQTSNHSIPKEERNDL